MRMLYFDISDIIDYAMVDHRVTGIQRVQARLISALRRAHGPDKVAAVFYHPEWRRVVRLDPLFVFDHYEFQASALLQKVGLGPKSIWPQQRQIKRYLRPYDNRKLLRAAKKLDIYRRVLLDPDSLAERGLYSLRRAAHVTPAPLTPLDSLPQQDTLVFLGANWNADHMTPFAVQHAQSGGQVVQLIYDLIPIHAPHWLSPEIVRQFRELLLRTTEFATRYACISDATQRELRAYLTEQGLDRFMHTVPLAHEFMGFERQARPDPALLAGIPGLDPNRPYALFVGTIENRKNVRALLRVWHALAAELGPQTPQLVVAGKRGRDAGEFFSMLEGDASLRRHVRIVDAPQDATLAALYANALFTVFPSLYEGWGLPVGESAWFGKLCVTSSSSSLPEVCGPYADYADPHDESAMLAAFRRCATDMNYRAMREQQIAKAPLRSWDDVAADLYDFCTLDQHQPRP